MKTKKTLVAATLTAALLAGLSLSPAQARERAWDGDRGRERDWCEVRKHPRGEEPPRRWDRGRPPWASDWRRYWDRDRPHRSGLVVVEPRIAVPLLVPLPLPGGRELLESLLGYRVVYR